MSAAISKSFFDLVESFYVVHITTTAISITVNLLAIYVIRVRSRNAALKAYSKPLIGVIVVSTLSDVNFSVLSNPIPLLPRPCAFSSGIFFSLFDVNVNILMSIGFFLIQLNAPALFACFIHRYQAVLLPSSPIQIAPWVLKALFVFVIILCSTFPILNYLAAMSSEESTVILLKDTENEEYVHIEGYICYIVVWPSYGLFACLQALLTAVMSMIGMLGFYLIIVRNLRQHTTLSKRSKAQQQQLLYTLLVQAVLPIICCSFPGVYIAICIIFHNQNDVLLFLAVQILTMHSLFNGIVTLVLTPSYRRYTTELLCRWICCQKPLRLLNITAVQVKCPHWNHRGTVTGERMYF